MKAPIKKQAPKPKAKAKPKAKVSAKRGAPSKMNEEIFEKIINRLSFSELGLRKCCEEAGIVPNTFYKYFDGKPDLLIRYARARELQSEYLFDLQREVAFERSQDHTPFTGSNVIQRDKLIVDVIKWQASKLNPKKYGDKIEVDQKTEHSGTVQQIVGMRIINEPKIEKK